MPVLRSQGVDGALRPSRRQGSRRADGNRRRVRRKGRIPVHDRGARGAALDQVRAARENRLRPHGGYGCHHEAASFANAPSHCRGQGWQNSGRRNRVHHRWRRLRDVVLGGPIARHYSRRRSLLLAERAHSSEGLGDKYASAWSLSRIWGAAESLCHGAAHGPHRSGRWHLAGEVRRRNFLKPGQTTTTQQVIREEIDLSHLLDRALELSDYAEKKARFAEENKVGMRKKGIGIAAFLHGAGFTGSGERYLNSLVGVEAYAEGSVRVLVSSAEFGQGTNTVLCQIAAEALGLP